MLVTKSEIQSNQTHGDDKAPRIEDWRLDYDRIVGRVFDHSIFPDGALITTSSVVDLTERIAMTRNTVYVLGRKARHD